jgi:hypothetical protein
MSSFGRAEAFGAFPDRQALCRFCRKVISVTPYSFRPSVGKIPFHEVPNGGACQGSNYEVDLREASPNAHRQEFVLGTGPHQRYRH